MIEKVVKHANNYVVEKIDDYVSNELADIYLEMMEAGIPEELQDFINSKINNSLNYIKSQMMED